MFQRGVCSKLITFTKIQTAKTMEAILDKEQISKSLKELAVSEPDFVKHLLLEVANELKQTKRQRLEGIINEDFNEYEAVFRALA